MRFEPKRIFAAFEKIEEQEDGTLKVYGIASSESEDSDGETVKASAIRQALPDYLTFGAIREMHQPIAAGTAIEASVDAGGVTHLGAHIVDAQSCLKVRTGVLKGFSIGGKVTKRDAANKRVITGLKLNEISLVDRPANPDALITLVKFDAKGRIQEEPAAKATSSANVGAMKKGMYDVGTLAELISRLDSLRMWSADEANWEGDDSPVPAQLADAVANLCNILLTMVDEETRELLGIVADADGVVDLAAAAKMCGALELAKKGAKFSSSTVEVLGKVHGMIDECSSFMHKLEYTKADNLEEEPMTDEEKAAKAVLEGDLAKAAGRASALEAENAELRASVEKATAAATDAAAIAKKATDALEEGMALIKAANLAPKGNVRAVPKTEDVAATRTPADEIDKSKKPTDFDAEFRNTVRNPVPAIGGGTFRQPFAR